MVTVSLYWDERPPDAEEDHIDTISIEEIPGVGSFMVLRDISTPIHDRVGIFKVVRVMPVYGVYEKAKKYPLGSEEFARVYKEMERRRTNTLQVDVHLRPATRQEWRESNG